MGHDAVLGSQQFEDIQVVDRTHSAIIRSKIFRQGQGELPRGKMVAPDKNGDLAPYEPALASAGTWAVSTVYAAGDLILPTVGNDHYYRCVTGGTSHTAEPAWPTDAGATIADNEVTWEEAGIIGVDDLTRGGVLVERMDTDAEEVGSVIVHGCVVKDNLDVAGDAAAQVDVEALEDIGVFAI